MERRSGGKVGGRSGLGHRWELAKQNRQSCTDAALALWYALSINPFVIFLGASPGGSPPPQARSLTIAFLTDCRRPRDAHPKLDVPDGRHHYWLRVRELGSAIIRARTRRPLLIPDAEALIGQLNLGTRQCGKAKNAPFDKRYCEWVPEAIMDDLRPSYVILLGLASRLTRPDSGFDPFQRCGIDWTNPDQSFAFNGYRRSKYRYRIWTRKRSDHRTVRFVLWPQHPSRAPMTKASVWTESGSEFILHSGIKTNED